MDAIYNWTNHLIPNTREKYEKIAKKIETRLAQGFNLEQSVDLLLGDGENLNDIEQVVNHLLSLENEKEVISSNERKIPVKYADIQDDVASLLKQSKPKEFASIFASKNSLMSLSDKKYNEFEELVWYAKKHADDPSMMEELHHYMRPYLEQAIQDSQILAKEAQENGNFKFKKVANNLYKVKDNKESYQVDIENRTCTCPRYILCGFNLLGLACEHILEASRKFDENFNEEVIGNKTVFAQNYGNNIRYAWCDRANNEIVIEHDCIAANCPFLQKDNGDTITCSFC